MTPEEHKQLMQVLVGFGGRLAQSGGRGDSWGQALGAAGLGAMTDRMAIMQAAQQAARQTRADERSERLLEINEAREARQAAEAERVETERRSRLDDMAKLTGSTDLAKDMLFLGARYGDPSLLATARSLMEGQDKWSDATRGEIKGQVNARTGEFRPYYRSRPDALSGLAVPGGGELDPSLVEAALKDAEGDDRSYAWYNPIGWWEGARNLTREGIERRGELGARGGGPGRSVPPAGGWLGNPFGTPETFTLPTDPGKPDRVIPIPGLGQVQADQPLRLSTPPVQSPFEGGRDPREDLDRYWGMSKEERDQFLRNLRYLPLDDQLQIQQILRSQRSAAQGR